MSKLKKILQFQSKYFDVTYIIIHKINLLRPLVNLNLYKHKLYNLFLQQYIALFLNHAIRVYFDLWLCSMPDA